MEIDGSSYEQAADNFRNSDWVDRLTARFGSVQEFRPSHGYDLIVSNPPYLSEKETDETLTEVKDYEPRIALTPGESELGLESYEIIISQAAAHLASSGLLAMETGIAQREALEVMLTRPDFSRYEFVADLTDRERFVFAWK